jgi:hypothetical protein
MKTVVFGRSSVQKLGLQSKALKGTRKGGISDRRSVGDGLGSKGSAGGFVDPSGPQLDDEGVQQRLNWHPVQNRARAVSRGRDKSSARVVQRTGQPRRPSGQMGGSELA